MSVAAPVLIAGGGIGGLATAIALAQHGIAARVLEQRAEFSEAGAGIQLGPNGVHALRRLGVDRLLAPHVAKPAEIIVHDGAAATVLARLPLGDWIERRHGAPYWVAHRRDVQAVLLARAAALPLLTITTGFAAARVEDTEAGARVQSETGEVADGTALIAADGLFSRLRRTRFNAPPLTFSGKIAARTVLDAAAVAGMLDIASTGVWLTPNAHVVHYPVRAGREVAIVAIIDEDWREEDWGAPVDRHELMRKLARFSPRLLGALEHASEWRRWALFDADPLPSWTSDRVTLLGDAAHPILPFLAQGGVMALEDAVTLAYCVHRQPNAIAAALHAYQTARRARAARVVNASRRNGRIYHLSGFAALARNAVLRSMPGAHVMAGLDWLYGWQGQNSRT